VALSDTEIDRIRYHTGSNLLKAGAEPYIGNVNAVYDEVIQTYARTAPTTTSNTAVVAAGSPTPVTLTLADATGIEPYERVLVDVDSRLEPATVQSKTGSDITLMLTLAHTGTYPVAVFSGETQIRYLLNKCEELERQKGSSGTFGSAGLERVDEVWFNTGGGGNAVYKSLADQLMGWRDSLCMALGLPNGWRLRQNAGLRTEAY
jgi:hypothetical protein